MNSRKEKWVIKRRGGAMEDMVSKLGITPAFARILCGRGYDTAEKAAAFLYPDGAELTAATAMPDAERFCAFLRIVRAEGKKVRVIGDYDADGVTATFLMLQGLERFGIRADYRIPNRVTDGYGISTDMVREAHEDGVSVLITVDNGIAAVEPVRLAKEFEMTVLVTDHHEPQEKFPEADVLVDPKTDPDYPGTAVCGAVVAGKLMDYLLSEDGKPGFLEEHIEIFALATVADVMQLIGENRIIVQKGLAKPLTSWNTGLRALAEANGLKTEPKAYTLGFVFAPCINALGRLKDAAPGVELLFSKDYEEAKKLAESMVDANAVRKEMTAQAIDEASLRLDSEPGEEALPIVYRSPICHESIAGIVAGKLRERYYLPAIVLCESTGEKGILKGSGRSIEGYSIFDGLSACKDYLIKFGGHAQACGLTLSEENLTAFREALSEHFRRSGAEAVEKISIDLVVTFADLNEQLCAEIGRMEPFGNGNAKPVFASRGVTVSRIGHFGRSTKYTRLLLTDTNGTKINGVYFGNADEFVGQANGAWGRAAVSEAYAGRGTGRMNILFTPQVSSYSHEIEVTVDRFQFL